MVVDKFRRIRNGVVLFPKQVNTQDVISDDVRYKPAEFHSRKKFSMSHAHPDPTLILLETEESWSAKLEPQSFDGFDMSHHKLSTDTCPTSLCSTDGQTSSERKPSVSLESFGDSSQPTFDRPSLQQHRLHSSERKLVRTKSGRHAHLVDSAADECETVGVLEFSSGAREIRRSASFCTHNPPPKPQKRFRKQIVRTKSGRHANLVTEASDESETVGVLEFRNGAREIRRTASYFTKSTRFVKKAPTYTSLRGDDPEESS